jgi:hypothetical protein
VFKLRSNVRITSVEIDTSLEIPLLVLWLAGDLDVVNPTGTTLIRISSRPCFAPLTPLEVLRVTGALRTADVCGSLPLSVKGLPASMSIALIDWPNGSAT